MDRRVIAAPVPVEYQFSTKKSELEDRTNAQLDSTNTLEVYGLSGRCWFQRVVFRGSTYPNTINHESWSMIHAEARL